MFSRYYADYRRPIQKKLETRANNQEKHQEQNEHTSLGTSSRWITLEAARLPSQASCRFESLSPRRTALQPAEGSVRQHLVCWTGHGHPKRGVATGKDAQSHLEARTSKETQRQSHRPRFGTEIKALPGATSHVLFLFDQQGSLQTFRALHNPLRFAHNMAQYNRCLLPP